jgi:hypothetical protein
MVNQIRQAKFRGKKYNIRWTKDEGLGSCEHPNTKGKTITLHPELSGNELIRVAVDEAIHACFWELDNDSVGEASESIAKFLHDLGIKHVQD